MPYIEQEARNQMDAGRRPATPGELNYLVTKAMLNFVDYYQTSPLEQAVRNFQSDVDDAVERFCEGHGTSYTTFNNTIGALVCAGLEWNRRQEKWAQVHEHAANLLNDRIVKLYTEQVAPYEDTKINQNGDVYPCN